MDAHTLKVLEYGKVLERLASHTSNAMGREMALSLEPSPFPEIVARRLQETREALVILDTESGLPLGGIHDVRSAVERAARDMQLAPVELLDVCQTLGAARRMKAYLTRGSDRHPLLSEVGSNIAPIPSVEARIDECIAENGEVRDTATPELARARRQIKIVHARLMDRLNGILTGERYRTYVQEPIVTEREGRYCIPVKSEHRGQFAGIVHDASASGATVFIEPGPCIELGNEAKELTIQEEREVYRILTRLSAMIGEAADGIRAALSILANLDMVNARALLAREMDASEPRVNTRGNVELVNARHPLLPGKVVPIDLEVGDRYTTLLVTGPNTGGKTVALKTLGLMALMHQSGLQIPASPSTDMPVFEHVFADIGDEQDIQQSLSTFSAHLKNIVRILRDAHGSSLVLLDEVGAGTDPAEGASLAKAILDALAARGARVVATTHYGELKEYAYSRPYVDNAAVEFDRESLRPTYRILMGVPGSSHAFYIAERLGMPADVVEAARGNLSSREQTTSELLQQIEASRARTFEMEREAAVAKQAAEDARKDYETRARQVADVQRTVRRETEEQARLVLRRASDKAEGILDELRKMNRGKRKGTTARQDLTALRQEVAADLAADEAEEVDETPPPPGGYVFHKGDRVRVTSLGAEGELLEDPRKGEVAVQIGAMRATLPTDVLRPGKPAAKTASRPADTNSEIALRKATHISSELTLRAMRVDEAAPLLDRYIDDAYSAGLQQARIIHGKGTGALRKFVHEALKSHPVVAGLRLGDETEGGDGVTIVTFKE